MANNGVIQCFYKGKVTNSIPINVVYHSDYKNWLKDQHDSFKSWIHSSNFKSKSNNYICIPSTNGTIDSVLVIADQTNPSFALGKCANNLPEGDYHLESYDTSHGDELILGWGRASYRFEQYKKSNKKQVRLSISAASNEKQVLAILKAINLVRDMINASASDMMPQHIQDVCQKLTSKNKVKMNSIIGQELLAENYPIIHAVGRASVHEPRLIEWKWGEPRNPKVTLIGKGVSFDSGGLDIKSAPGMRLMKKDMGGAAHAIGLASAIMELNLPIQLQVLIPAVENAISGDAYRPGDVLVSRSGKSIEVDNTDAEGRLILCDCLTRALENDPQLIIDFATLTGAARIALGTEVPAFFSNDDALAENLISIAAKTNDPIWQLPLYKPYRYLLDSDIADISNCSTSSYGGAITAALFLNEFVDETTSWVHFDVMAWNIRNRPSHPKGGEAMGLHTVLKFLQNKYAS